jgi:hypothetical protein
MAKAATRAVRDFAVLGDPWPAVDGWAARQGYKIMAEEPGHRLYSKGGLMAAQRRVELRQMGDQMHLEAWVFVAPLARTLSLFTMPKEITIESGGMKGAVPRKMGRTEVNDLLAAMGQQAIP